MLLRMMCDVMRKACHLKTGGMRCPYWFNRSKIQACISCIIIEDVAIRSDHGGIDLNCAMWRS